MAKLYFRYGAVSSAKTLNLLAVAHNYERQGKKVMVLKPEFDTRFGETRVVSRAGLERKADLIINAQTNLDPESFAGCHCILVDEAQFLSAEHVDQLRMLTHSVSAPVICYGLRADFRTRLFPGSRRLLELADTIEEVKTTCAFCNRKAVFNLKSVEGTPTVDGPSQELGAEELYLPVCFSHYSEKLDFDVSRLLTHVSRIGESENRAPDHDGR